MAHPILIVEDDTTISTIVSGYLASEGIASEVVDTGQEALRRIAVNPYSLVLLDLGLPDEDGLAILRKLHSRTTMPIMVVSARNTLDARLTAFELGAADILAKPFDPRELRYRIQNLLKRERPANVQTRFTLGRWTLDTATHTVSHTQGQAAALTSQEFALLQTLACGNGRVLSRSQLIDATTSDAGPDSERAIDILVSRLRKKLSADTAGWSLVTVRGIGYRLECASPATV